MAKFNLTSGVDAYIGSNASDNFVVGAAGELTAADSLVGGQGAGIDSLVIAANVTVLAADLAGASGFERVVITSAAGAIVTLSDSFVSTSKTGAFTVLGGAGDDTVNAAKVVSLGLTMGGNNGDDVLSGGKAGDVISGGLSNDRLAGNAGDDALAGDDGNDTLSGGNGSDLLKAGAGTDLMDGGKGNDSYEFAPTEFNVTDLIADEAGDADTLRFVGAAGMIIGAALADRIGGIERIKFGNGADTLQISVAMTDGAGTQSMEIFGAAVTTRWMPRWCSHSARSMISLWMAETVPTH